MIRRFFYVVMVFNILGLDQVALAMTSSAKPMFNRRHRAAFLDNPMYERLAQSLDKQKSKFKQHATVYLAIPKEFVFKEKALSGIKAYAQSHGVSLPFSVRNYISDAENYAGKPLRVEFNYVSLFDPNIAQPVIVPSAVYGSGRALTSHDFSVLKPYVPAGMLREFAAFLKEYADRIGYAQYFLVQLSIPNDRVDMYVQSQAVDGDYYALLYVKPDDALDHAERFTVRLIQPNAPVLSNEDKTHLDRQFDAWIERIGAAVVSEVQKAKAAAIPALLPRPQAIKKQSPPALLPRPQRVQQQNPPALLPRPKQNPPALLPRPAANGLTNKNRYARREGAKTELIGQIKAGTELRPTPPCVIKPEAAATGRGALLQQIQGGTQLRPAQTRVANGIRGAGKRDDNQLAILNRAVNRAKNISGDDASDAHQAEAAADEWEMEETIVRDKPVIPENIAAYEQQKTGFHANSVHKQETIGLHANRMNKSTETALVQGLERRRRILREENDSDNEDDWDDE